MRTYYSPGMATHPRFPERRRARPGSLERPVNGRMYRGTWLLVGIPLLVAAFSVARPQALRAPLLPPQFDQGGALLAANVLARQFPDRSPGSAGADRAAAWVSDQFQELGFAAPEVDRFHAKIAGRGDVRLQNLIVTRPGRTSDAIVVMAHRDNTGAGPGANENASGTAALIELARAYAQPTAQPQPPEPNHTLVFLSTDAGSYGALGAERFARSPAWRDRVVAVVNLDAIASRGPPRVEIGGERSRSPNAALVRTVSARVAEQTGRTPEHASPLAQLIDLAFPFSLYEQAPFVGRGTAAVTLTTGGARPPAGFDDSPERLDERALGRLGRAAQALLGSLDTEVELAQGTSSYVYLGTRAIRGWAVIFILIGALLPCLAAIVDLFARLRRRKIPIAPALRSFRSRLAFWAFAGLLFEAFALIGVWSKGAARPLPPEASPATEWPILGLVVFACLLALAWLVARERLIPRRTVLPEEELAGYTGGLLALAVVSLLVIATNPYALIFVLPSLHAWLWLPQVGRGAARVALLLAGFAGPALLLGSFAFRFDLGLDAPWYLAQLAAVGYVPFASVLIVCGWLAVAGQLAALTARRYAPYPDASERPPLGPVRAVARRALVGIRGRRFRIVEDRRASTG